MNTGTLVALIAGTPHDHSSPDFDSAVATRAALIIPALTQRTGDYMYSGNRTQPENLGWRLRQAHGEAATTDQIRWGFIDHLIADAWHAAASAEYYYRYEKDWGDFS